MHNLRRREPPSREAIFAKTADPFHVGCAAGLPSLRLVERYGKGFHGLPFSFSKHLRKCWYWSYCTMSASHVWLLQRRCDRRHIQSMRPPSARKNTFMRFGFLIGLYGKRKAGPGMLRPAVRWLTMKGVEVAPMNVAPLYHHWQYNYIRRT